MGASCVQTPTECPDNGFAVGRPAGGGPGKPGAKEGAELFVILSMTRARPQVAPLAHKFIEPGVQVNEKG